MKVKPFIDYVLFRRPCRVLDPLIAAGSESHRLRTLGASFVFQVIGKERRENVFAIVLGGRASKVPWAKLASLTSGPAAVVPRTDDQEVLFLSIVPFEQFVDLDRTVEV